VPVTLDDDGEAGTDPGMGFGALPDDGDDAEGDGDDGEILEGTDADDGAGNGSGRQVLWEDDGEPGADATNGKRGAGELKTNGRLSRAAGHDIIYCNHWLTSHSVNWD
jgi:hypothetical protein